MKRVMFLAAILVFVLAVPALAQDGGEFCAIPEGCDLDGDGVAETPAGASVPTEDQYGPEEEFCAIPEGCGASAPPDPTQDSSASPDPTEESSASPSPPAAGVEPAPEDGASSAPASSPTDGGRDASSDAASSTAGGGTERGTGTDGESTGASAPSAGDDRPGAGLTVLPETGGVSAAVPGLGAALVAGGMLLRRVFR